MDTLTGGEHQFFDANSLTLTEKLKDNISMPTLENDDATGSGANSLAQMFTKNKNALSSKEKIWINKKFEQIKKHFLNSIDLYSSFITRVNEIEDALKLLKELWNFRKNMSNKNSVYSMFVNLIQNQILIINADKLSIQHLNKLFQIFHDLTIDTLNEEKISDIAFSLEESNFPVLEELL